MQIPFSTRNSHVQRSPRKIKSDTFPINSLGKFSKRCRTQPRYCVIFALSSRECLPNFLQPVENSPSKKRRLSFKSKRYSDGLDRGTSQRYLLARASLIIVQVTGVEICRVGGMFVFNCVYPSIRCQRDIRQRRYTPYIPRSRAYKQRCTQQKGGVCHLASRFPFPWCVMVGR